MKITIECEPKEIAAVVVKLQKQPIISVVLRNVPNKFITEVSNLFVLTVKIHKDFYYVVDLHGSLSKSIADSMIFINKENALTYAGDLEAKLEEKFMMPISVYVKEIS